MDSDRLVVGFDGSAGARDALRWALELALRDGRSVEAVGVWRVPVVAVSPWVPLPPPVDFDESLRLHEENLAAAIEDVRRDVSGAPAVALGVVEGFAGSALVEHAAGAGLLVVGRRGRGGFAGLLLGSVADHCLQNASAPVALVPPGPPRPIRAVSAGIDGSEHARDALRWAADEASRLGVDVVAVHAWSWLDQVGDFDPEYGRDEARAQATQQVRDTLGDRAVEVALVNDLPARALMERSAAGDLVVVARRGLGAVREVLLGSVSRELAHHAPSTVVVIPAGV